MTAGVRRPRLRYASPTGRRFHSIPYCEGLNSYSVANERDAPTVTRGEVIRRGLAPCRICKPSPVTFQVVT